MNDDISTLENITENTAENTSEQENDNSELKEKLQGQINEMKIKIEKLQNEIDKIDEGVAKVNSCLNQKDENGVIVLSQGYTTFNWLMNNMDRYWTDMEGSVKKECMEYYKKLNDESTGPIAIVKAEASGVLKAAEEKRTELVNELENAKIELGNLESSLENLQ